MPITKPEQPSERPAATSGTAPSAPVVPSPLVFTPVPEAPSTTLNDSAAALLSAALNLPSQAGPGIESLYTTADLFADFPDDDVCLEYIKEQIWPRGLVQCLKCGVARKHYRVSGRKAYACNHCGRHIYPLAGTIFSKSTTPLRTWFYVLYLMLSTRGQISARQIQRETGVTYKTAWRSRGQIAALLSPEAPLPPDGRANP